MDLLNWFINFFPKSLLFNLVIILVTFILGWIFYNKIIMRRVNLRDSLFEKDNVAVWIEFIGAFIFPVLYLSAKAIEGSTSDNIFIDLLICLVYVIGYMIVFTLLRLLSGIIIKIFKPSDENGHVRLETEIVEQRNTAAALYSTALSVIFVSLVRFLDFSGAAFLLASVYKILIIFVFTIAGIILYCFSLGRKTTLYKELFIDNNPAAGVAFAGFLFGLQVITTGVTQFFPGADFDFMTYVVSLAACLLVFGLLTLVFKFFFAKLIKVNLLKEIYEQNSIGASIGLTALYIGVANIIIHFIQ